MADYAISKEKMAGIGTRYVVRRDGVRLGSAATRAQANRMVREAKAARG